MMHPAPSTASSKASSSTKRARETSPGEHEYECDATVRKNNHRLVEQRRREKMNSLIDELSSLLPSQFLNAQPSRTRPNILTAAISYLEVAQKVLTALDVPLPATAPINGTINGSDTTRPTSNLLLLPESVAFVQKTHSFELSTPCSSTDSSALTLNMPTTPDLSNISSTGISLSTQQTLSIKTLGKSHFDDSSYLRSRNNKSKPKIASSSLHNPSSLLPRTTISPIGNLHATGPLVSSSSSSIGFPLTFTGSQNGHIMHTEIYQYLAPANDNSDLDPICARGEDDMSARRLTSGEFSSEHVHSDPNLHLESLSMGSCGVAAAAAALASAFENNQQIAQHSSHPSGGLPETRCNDTTELSAHHNGHHVSVDELSMYS